MLRRLISDHVIKQSPTCGEIREILRGTDYSPNVAIVLNIQTTTPHFHRTFEEIYFVLDGTLRLKFYDPKSNAFSEQTLAANELCVIPVGVHHQVVEASPENRLCVITVPRFDPADEHVSTFLASSPV